MSSRLRGTAPMKRWAIVLLALALLAAASAALGAGPRGSRGNPYPIRTTVRLPAGQGWKLRVNKSIPNATRLVLDWNRFNTPPKGGHQFFIINITLAYSGKGSASPFAPTHLFAVGRSKVEYSMVDDSCGGSVRGQLNFATKVVAGGRITGNVCFSVWKTDVRSLLHIYETSPLTGKVAKVYFRVR